MSMRLKDGDYFPDGNGGFCRDNDNEALLARVLFRLCARRGGFPLLPQIGSRLYRLPQERPSRRAALAKEYIEEALAEEEGLEIERITWREESGALLVELRLREEGFSLRLTPGQWGGIV